MPTTPTVIDMREGKISELFVLDPAENPQEIIVPKGEYTVIHLNKKDDGTTASAAGDIVILGAKVGFSASYVPGPNKVPLYPIAGGSQIQCVGLDTPKETSSEKRPILLKAVGSNKVLMLIIKGWMFYRAR